MQREMSDVMNQTCRVCRSKLRKVFTLGEQPFSGIFPKTKHEEIPKTELALYRCQPETKGCNLVQLGSALPTSYMYGEHYGYRSGLNSSMVHHLKETVQFLTDRIILENHDYVLDVGSNDGTLLGFYPDSMDNLYGIDPSVKKFERYYKAHIKKINNFFSAELIKKSVGDAKFKVITSLSMFYDLPDPVGFMRSVRNLLHVDGLWLTEQSDLLQMINSNSFDTICHEHLLYYSLSQIRYMADLAGLRIVDVGFNDTNGGSSRVLFCRAEDEYPTFDGLDDLIQNELRFCLDEDEIYSDFQRRADNIKIEINKCLDSLLQQGLRVYGLGASTKGNVLLNWCEIGPEKIAGIFDVNPDKHGAYCPGTNIPIIDDAKLELIDPDFLLVLPWHFRLNFLDNKRYRKFPMIFPLPTLEIYKN